VSMNEIDPSEAHRRLREEPGTVYLDVRTPEEFAAGHPEGATNIPIAHSTPAGMQPNEEFAKAVSAVIPKDTPLVVGCKAGGRSAAACRALSEMGYERLANVAGGYGGAVDPQTGQTVVEGWAARGLPTATTPAPGRSWDEVRRRAAE